MNPIIPKAENEHVGFKYTVSNEQIEAYAKLTIHEKLEWLERTAKFIYDLQTPEERLFSRKIKGKPTGEW